MKFNLYKILAWLVPFWAVLDFILTLVWIDSPNMYEANAVARAAFEAGVQNAYVFQYILSMVLVAGFLSLWLDKYKETKHQRVTEITVIFITFIFVFLTLLHITGIIWVM